MPQESHNGKGGFLEHATAHKKKHTAVTLCWLHGTGIGIRLRTRLIFWTWSRSYYPVQTRSYLSTYKKREKQLKLKRWWLLNSAAMARSRHRLKLKRAVINVGRLRALPMQDSITESKTINYILFIYFADVAPYLLKKEVEKIRLQVLSYLDSKSTLFEVINNFRLHDRVCIVSALRHPRIQLFQQQLSEVPKVFHVDPRFASYKWLNG